MNLRKNYFLAVFFVAILPLCGGGCSWPWSTPQYESYHPVIRDLTVYPGMRSRKEFWEDHAKFWKEHQDQKPTVDELLQWTWDLDTVLEAREKQIRAYNEWAEEQNAKNSYGPKDF